MKSTVKGIHQTIGNLLCTLEVEEETLYEYGPGGILATTVFAIIAIVYTTINKTPTYLVFGCYILLNILHNKCWKIIKNRKQKLINKNNIQENQNQIDHYTVVNTLIKHDLGRIK